MVLTDEDILDWDDDYPPQTLGEEYSQSMSKRIPQWKILQIQLLEMWLNLFMRGIFT